MTRILLLRYDPETVDFSDPALPPGMTTEKVHAGIAVALKQFAERGWESDVCFIRPDETAGPTVERQVRFDALRLCCHRSRGPVAAPGPCIIRSCHQRGS
jgi:hypothetical protein